MGIDVLILNTAVTDLRRHHFTFADKLVGKGGLAKCKTKDMPKYSQKQIWEWIQQGYATAGGPGNAAPLMTRTGLEVAVGVLLGKGKYDGLDAQGRFFYDTLEKNGVDVSQIIKHPKLPTGTTFIHEIPGDERGGIAYFPNANNKFHFGYARGVVGALEPKIVYYMYSGLSDRGDANGGKDLADFVMWCRERDIVTIVDTHTLTGNPQEVIESGKPVEQYRLLEPLLPNKSDLFFTSLDEAKMIANTFGYWEKGRRSLLLDNERLSQRFLDKLIYHAWLKKDQKTRLFGITFDKGAFYVAIRPNGRYKFTKKVESKFMAGEAVDLVGAGDAFRAGLLTYIAKDLDAFKNGTINFEEAVQMGNLFASLYIKAPLEDRYGDIREFKTMLKIVKSGKIYETFDQLKFDLNPIDGTQPMLPS